MNKREREESASQRGVKKQNKQRKVIITLVRQMNKVLCQKSVATSDTVTSLLQKGLWISISTAGYTMGSLTGYIVSGE